MSNKKITFREIFDQVERERKQALDISLEEFAAMTPPTNSPFSQDQMMTYMAEVNAKNIELARIIEEQQKRIVDLEARLQKEHEISFNKSVERERTQLELTGIKRDMLLMNDFLGRVLTGLNDLAGITKRLHISKSDPVRSLIFEKIQTIAEDARIMYSPGSFAPSTIYAEKFQNFQKAFKHPDHLLFAESRALAYQYALRGVLTYLQTSGSETALKRANGVLQELLFSQEIDALNDEATMSRLKFEDAASLLLYWQAIINKLKPLILDGLAALERLDLLTPDTSSVYSQIITVLYRVWNNVDAEKLGGLCPVCNSSLQPLDDPMVRRARTMP